MSPATKMWSVTTPLISKARQPASQPTPQKPAASPAPFQPFDVADGTERGQDEIDVERGSVGELGAPDVPAGVALERQHRIPCAGPRRDPAAFPRRSHR